MILVLVGRSASGKSVIAKLLKKNHGYVSVRTATTRDRRDGEPEDAYYFMTKDEFLQRKNNDEFVEWDVYHNNYYGTLKAEIQKNADQVIVLTPEGAENIKKAFPDAFIVHISTDMKTAVMRAIEREDFLTPKKLHKITDRGCTDEYLYKDQKCDFVCSNLEGTDLIDHARYIANAHKDWKDKQEF